MTHKLYAITTLLGTNVLVETITMRRPKASWGVFSIHVDDKHDLREITEAMSKAVCHDYTVFLSERVIGPKHRVKR